MKLGIDVIDSTVAINLKLHTRKIWICDWIILELLDQITIVYDANMWRIYATAQHKSLDFLSESEMVTMCNFNKKAIDLFIRDQILFRINAIIKRWKEFAEVAEDVFLGAHIPTGAVSALKQVLEYQKNTVGSDDESSRMLNLATLRSHLQINAIRQWDDNSSYALSTSEIRGFMNVIDYEFSHIAKFSSADNTTAGDYKTRLIRAIELTKTLLLLCRSCTNDLGSINPVVLFDDLVRWNQSYGKIGTITRRTAQLGNLSLAHAVCLDETSCVDLVPVGDSTKVTDTYRMLTATLILASLLKEVKIST